MKPIKKFSTEMNQPKSILESLDSTTLDELIKGMGFKNIHELKREKNLLSKLEALVKEVNQKPDLNEDDADDIEDDILKKGKPKSLEDKAGEKEPDVIIGSKEDEMGIAEEETEEEFDGEETEEESDEDEEIEKEEESAEAPKATRKIMTFEDFIQEETTTANKKVSHQDDEEDDSDLTDPTDDSNKPEADVKNNEIEETVSNTKTAVKSFSQFISEAMIDKGPDLKDEYIDYEGSIVVPVAKGDGSKAASDIEDEVNDKGEPKIKDNKEGEELVTNDQKITKKPKTSKDEVEIHSTVVVNEAKVKSNDEFKEYAFTVLQNAFGDDFDEAKAQEVVDGLTSKYSRDYGAMVGALKASLGQ
jgi:hypothetical protein